ncbi:MULTISPECIES: precorrin-6A synthase (deacetylating) [Sphingomonas]|nr:MULTISPECIES: precorrin-6A synthase (deacetylating) [Sphingomonas]MBB4047157.1 precorrin-6A synthase [Sphingomonas zeae]MDK8186380.1 precorrin-6A synthase (deacetylating) [Sphingomonas zeae]MDK8215999.1 precorrin-6A synthase (deacetylating) [Sphingomonas sp. UMB7805-LC452B]
MIHLDLIGIGTGNPEHLTRAAEAAMRAADLILLPRKADKAELIDLRRDICAQVLAGTAVRVVEFDLPVRSGEGAYLDSVEHWHDAIAECWAGAIAAHLPGGGRVALLVWGDPSLYDSTIRIARRLVAVERVTVVPGITSLQALCAAHAIPFNAVGAPVMVTTGRRLRDGGWPDGADSVAVMLDGGCAFTTLDQPDAAIWWGAYLGMAQQAIDAGRLADVAERIVARRAELRRVHGWIMDVYLLRRAGDLAGEGIAPSDVACGGAPTPNPSPLPGGGA